MVSRKSGEPSAESVAKANRRRIAAEEGRQALAEVERDGIAIRTNMARLRALREAEEVKQRDAQPSPDPAPHAKKKKSARKQVEPQSEGASTPELLS